MNECNYRLAKAAKLCYATDSINHIGILSEKVIKMDYEALGQRIRQQRKLMKMTQEELASVSDVSTSYIGHIERGIKHCSLDTLICICNSLQIPPNSLLQDSLDTSLLHADAELTPLSRDLLNDIVHVLEEHDKKIKELQS